MERVWKGSYAREFLRGARLERLVRRERLGVDYGGRVRERGFLPPAKLSACDTGLVRYRTVYYGVGPIYLV
jgi:hypothetical protein